MLRAINQPWQFVDDVRHRARAVVCASPFYHWLISSGDCPDVLRLRIPDPWPGRAEIGQMMCRGVLMRPNQSIRINQINWRTAGGHPIWGDVLNSFSWLRDLRAVGGDAARQTARQMFDEWMAVHDRWSESVWAPDIMGRRIIMWLSLFDFFCASADEEFQKRYFASLNAQARHLSRVFPANLNGIKLLQAAQGLIYAGLCLPGRDEWVVQGFQAILREIPRQILRNGTHISQSPQKLLQTLQILLDLRYVLNRANLPVPDIVQNAIERMGPALRFFVYPDRKLALFHGAQEDEAEMVDAILTQLRGSRRPIKGSALGGFERVMQGRAILMLDAGVAPDSPYDTSYHSAPLSFEFVYGRERIFTNCGGHPSHQGWQQGLRHTAAHNALTLNGMPVHDFAGSGAILRPHGPICSMRRENKNACLIDVAHDGFMGRYGIEHARRFYLSDQGHDLRGEDTLAAKIPLTGTHDVILRFHLHPRVLASTIADDGTVQLTLPGGSVWVFHAVGTKMVIEPSVFLGYGLKPLPCKQIVLSAQMDSEKLQIKWALQRL